MVLLAAYGLFLSHHSGSGDVTVASPFAGRERAETAHSIGCCFNTLGLRMQVQDTMTVAQLLTLVKSMCLDAFAHSDVQWGEVLREIKTPFRQ